MSDKSGLVEFAQFLHSHSVELISTGGTASTLRTAGIPVIEIDSFTGFPEILSGRVKTLHPKVHGALLAVRGHPVHDEQVATHGIPLIDMVVVNLYPFSATVASSASDYGKCVENIDIGGPAMLRSASKNHSYVAVVTDAAQYEAIKQEMSEGESALSLATRRRLAAAAFTLTATYDTAISTYLNNFKH